MRPPYAPARVIGKMIERDAIAIVWMRPATPQLACATLFSCSE
jgi:hypothetical protein